MDNSTFKIKIIFAILFLVFLVIFIFMQNSKNKDSDFATIKINNNVLQVEIAKSLLSQKKGLSDRDSLAQDRGMLFIYDDNRIRNFWMKDMRFALDVLWISDNKVVGLTENIPFSLENDQIRRFVSPVEADMVLEVNAGYIAKNGLKMGDSIDFISK